MNKRTVGTQYEAQAATYLQTQGYQILCRNFRCRSGEIDLVAYDPGENPSEKGTLVFVEVKYRRHSGSGLPEEAVSPRKQAIISRVADFYRVRYRVKLDQSCRFDVIAIEGENLRHYKNAFLYCGY